MQSLVQNHVVGLIQAGTEHAKVVLVRNIVDDIRVRRTSEPKLFHLV